MKCVNLSKKLSPWSCSRQFCPAKMCLFSPSKYLVYHFSLSPHSNFWVNSCPGVVSSLSLNTYSCGRRKMVGEEPGQNNTPYTRKDDPGIAKA